MKLLVEDADELIERLRTDKDLRDRIKAITTFEDRMKLIRSLGYECDVDAIKKAWDKYG